MPKYFLGQSPHKVEIEDGEYVLLMHTNMRMDFCVMLFGWDYTEIARMAEMEGNKHETIVISFVFCGTQFRIFINRFAVKYGFASGDINEDIIFDRIKIYPNKLVAEIVNKII